MRNGVFSLDVIPARRAASTMPYFRMGNGEKFKVVLGNTSDRPGVALLYVLGEKIAAVRVPAGRTDVVLEGPKDVEKFFTFDKDRTGVDPNVISAKFFLGDQPTTAPEVEVDDVDVVQDGGHATITLELTVINGKVVAQNQRTNDHQRIERKIPALIKDMSTETDIRLELVWDSTLDPVVIPAWNSGSWR